ncbi:MAG: hypothetical protein KBB62_03505 [Candidatus Pacebacteria bacterium]|nr:hypothetical protein [Candidatus Paceibacterota bacterium]MBP9711973.1 hypothetical protein [Candidatus Paceibacterota bacterium]
MVEEQKTKKYWFARKRYGWGWGLPLVWQGWVVFIVYFIAIIANFETLNIDVKSTDDLFSGYMPRFILLTVGLILICYWKGEKPKWSWGN